MSGHHGSGGFGLPESHLLPDAVVAFVDNELSTGATERAAEHLVHCPWCAADVDTQRQVRSAVRDAGEPSMSAGFLANLRSIPQDTELDETPDNLAVTEDGQLVAVQRPGRVAGLRGRSAGGAERLGGSAPLGGSTPLGQSGEAIGGSGNGRRRAAQGAGVVVSGLVLSALALVTTTGGTPAEPERPRGGGGDVNTNVLRAQFGGDGQPRSDRRTATSTTGAAADDAPAGKARAGNAPARTSHGGSSHDATASHDAAPNDAASRDAASRGSTTPALSSAAGGR